ncbi:hypothetical protein J7E69_21460, partial [Rhodococcus enclensis]|nr:hypothetical protein [Rhodococcus qingshengii]
HCHDSDSVVDYGRGHLGAEINVPLFINTGDKLKVDSRDGNYLGRVNS